MKAIDKSGWLRALLTVACVVGLVGSCSSPSGGGNAAPDEMSPSTSAGEDLPPWVIIPEGEEDYAFIGSDWMPGDPLPHSRLETWSAKTKIRRVELTQEEELSYHLDTLNQFTMTGGDDPLNGEELTFGPTRPFTEAWESIAQCLTDRGFPATTSPTGGLSFYGGGIPESQGPAVDVAMVECYTATPPDMSGNHYYAYEGEEILSVYFEYWTEAYIPCLGTIGIRSDEETPTKESFIDRRLNPDDSAETADDPVSDWWPPSWTAGAPEPDAACPPYPKDSQFME